MRNDEHLTEQCKSQLTGDFTLNFSSCSFQDDAIFSFIDLPSSLLRALLHEFNEYLTSVGKHAHIEEMEVPQHGCREPQVWIRLVADDNSTFLNHIFSSRDCVEEYQNYILKRNVVNYICSRVIEEA